MKMMSSKSHHVVQPAYTKYHYHHHQSFVSNVLDSTTQIIFFHFNLFWTKFLVKLYLFIFIIATSIHVLFKLFFFFFYFSWEKKNGKNLKRGGFVGGNRYLLLRAFSTGPAQHLCGDLQSTLIYCPQTTQVHYLGQFPQGKTVLASLSLSLSTKMGLVS